MKVKTKVLRWFAFLAVLAGVFLSVFPAYAQAHSAASAFASSSAASIEDTAAGRPHRAELTRKKKKKSSSYNSYNNNYSSEKETELTVEEDETYTSKEEVALYIHLFNHLPDNFITKNEAKDLGWVSSEGNLDEVAPGKSIGGDRFGNYEGQLPEKKGRKYFECDIDYEGGYRDSKRIVFSSDGLVYYTEDHYETFEKLY